MLTLNASTTRFKRIRIRALIRTTTKEIIRIPKSEPILIKRVESVPEKAKMLPRWAYWVRTYSRGSHRRAMRKALNPKYFFVLLTAMPKAEKIRLRKRNLRRKVQGETKASLKKATKA